MLAASLVYLQHGLVQQVDDDDEIQCTSLELIRSVECKKFLRSNSKLIHTVTYNTIKI